MPARSNSSGLQGSLEATETQATRKRLAAMELQNARLRMLLVFVIAFVCGCSITFLSNGPMGSSFLSYGSGDEPMRFTVVEDVGGSPATSKPVADVTAPFPQSQDSSTPPSPQSVPPTPSVSGAPSTALPTGPSTPLPTACPSPPPPPPPPAAPAPAPAPAPQPCPVSPVKLPPLGQVTAQLDLRQLSARGQVDSDVVARIFDLMTPYIEEAPPVPPRVTSRPVPLLQKLNCQAPAFAHLLTGQRRAKPVPVVDLILFSAELDVLELRLYELNDTVDYFLIMEGARTHRAIPKPLFFERNKERFQPFAKKIVHVILDEAQLHQFAVNHLDNGKHDWRIDSFNDIAVVSKFEQTIGTHMSQEERDSALFIYGDLDEIPEGSGIHHLKHCEIRHGGAIGSRSTFYNFNFNWIFRSDHPAPGDPYSLKFPEVFRWYHVHSGDQGKHFPRGSGSAFLPFGTHMTWVGRPGFLLYKYIAISEGTMDGGYLDLWSNADNIKQIMWDGWTAHSWHGRSISYKGMAPQQRAQYYIPWFARCNRDRFPYLIPPGFPETACE